MIDDVSLAVSDQARALAFYERVATRTMSRTLATG